MYKILLPAVLLSMTAMTAVANDDVIVRTGTCGATAPAENAQDCKSVGINLNTGEIVMSANVKGRDVWSKDITKVVVVGKLATHGALEDVKTRVLANEGAVAVNASGVSSNSVSIETNLQSVSVLQSEAVALDSKVVGALASIESNATEIASVVTTAGDNSNSIASNLTLIEAAGLAAETLTSEVDYNAAKIDAALSGILDGANGNDGADGADGLKGDTGAAGSNGSNGDDGVDGANGKDGTNGTNGKDGADGDTGLQGEAGLDLSDEVKANEDSIVVNADEIVTVKSAASLVKASVAVNKTNVSTNASAIALTSTKLSAVSGKVDVNKAAHDVLAVKVGETVSNLAATDVRVYANAQGVSTNSTSIGELRSFTNENRGLIMNNSSRIDYQGMAIGSLQRDIDRLDGQIAAQVAASASIMPSNWDGRFAVTVGVGSYRGQTGLALGIMHDNGDWAVKAQITGTDADNWGDLAVGASVGFAF